MIFGMLALSVATLGLSDLPQQKLEAGQCVTMLWSKAQPPIRIAMVNDQGQTIRLRRNGKDINLPATGPNSYAGADLSIALDISFRPAQNITDGAVIDSGSMEITTSNGETLVLPVGGIRACR